MKQSLLILTLLLVSNAITAQYSFEKGYFVENNGDTTFCLIQDKGWNTNPSSFDYKLNAGDQKSTHSIKQVQAFGIVGKTKYVRYIGPIENSPIDLERISLKKEPILIEETVFLKTIIEGKASLYQYVKGNKTQLFLRSHSDSIQLLIHKYYKGENGTTIKNNKTYIYQIQKALIDCTTIGPNEFGVLKYKRKPISKVVSAYNDCQGGTQISYVKKRAIKEYIRWRLKSGLSYSNLTVHNVHRFGNNPVQFSENTIPFIGTEVEFILPTNKNKWSVFLELSYQGLNRAITHTLPSGTTQDIAIDYHAIELAAGLRHYIYFNDHSKMFANASYSLPILSFDPALTLEGANDIDVSNIKGGLSLGAGYCYKRFNIELRYTLNQIDLFPSYLAWHSEYRPIAITLGYAILN